MKTVQILLQRTTCTIIVLMSCIAALFAQNEKATTTIKIIESRHYTFTAQTASPTSGRTRQLNAGYTLKVANDTIIADLPYFGRAYSAPPNLTGGGISFTSVKSGYSISQDPKKKKWEITIKPEDVNDVMDLSLIVFENGTADLRVNSRDRQPISFRGYVTAK